MKMESGYGEPEYENIIKFVLASMSKYSDRYASRYKYSSRYRKNVRRRGIKIKDFEDFVKEVRVKFHVTKKDAESIVFDAENRKHDMDMKEWGLKEPE